MSERPVAPTATVAAPVPVPTSARSITVRLQFASRTAEGIEGLLLAAGTSLAPDDRRAQVLAQLSELVRLAIDWPTDESEPNARIGDHRSLIVEFKPPDGIVRCVQILSEPGTELVMEAAPGHRADPALQALVDRLAPALAGRGFAIGGSADNFRKCLPAPRPGHAPATAAELTALLVDVLGWSGAEDLAFRLKQDTHRSADWITPGMTIFRIRFDRLTPMEKIYMRAMAQLGPGPHRSGDIAEVLKRKVTSLGPTRNKLIAKGMIWSPNHGDTDFTVPLFDEFMRRIVPGSAWQER